MKKRVILEALKVVGKHALDANYVVATLNEARENAYPGYYCYVETENRHYKFKFNEQRNLIPYPDETVNTDFFASKGEVDSKAEKEYVDTELAKKSSIGHSHSAYADVNHLHDTLYAKKSDIVDFATLTRVNAKADINHRHDADYASKTHGHSGYASADHLHDERYPTRAELLSGAGIQQYVHPAAHPAVMITTDATRRFTSDSEMATKVDKVAGKSLLLDSEIERLASIPKAEASTQNGNIKLNGAEVIVYQHPEGTNPHGLTAADIALEKVTNESKETMFQNPVFTGDITVPEPVSASNPTTKNFVEAELEKKVDKVVGKSLLLDSEIERLASLPKAEGSTQNGNIKLNGAEVPVYRHPEGSNPHGLTAADIALEKVTNESKETMFNNPIFTGSVTVPEPIAANNPTTKNFVENYVDNRITGLDQKAACRVATTANILLYGLQTIDGVNIGIGDRVLVKNQTDATKNGIYLSASGTWMRAADFDNTPYEEMRAGTYVFINEGTKNNNSGWRLTTYGTIVIGVSDLLFAQFNGLAQSIAGDGLLKNGNEYSLDLSRIATQTANGLMSSADKTKLDGIAPGANNYTHPATHPASVISQDANNRFVSDAEKAAWNAKASAAVATQTANGLMSSADKTKLDGVAPNANNYTHPVTHPASVISQDANNRFVTDAEKAAWSTKASTAVATQTANGLMSSADKTKLDNVANGAEVNVQSDFNEQNPASKAYIKNLPDFSKKTRDNCRVATTTNVSLTAAPNIIDGVSLAVGNRVFVSKQTNKTQNGIYIVSTVGTGANGVWIRATDADSWSKIYSCLVAVEEGATLADTGWFCKADAGGTLGTTDIIFQQIFGIGTYNGGVGIAFNNGSFSFSPSDANMLPGYAKASASAAIVPADSVNAALGKLERVIDDKQDKASPIFQLGSYFNKKYLGALNWSNDVQYQKTTIEIPITGTFMGTLFVKVLGSANYTTAVGLLIKKFDVVMNQTGAISSQDSRYIDRSLFNVTGLAISNLFWNTATGKYNITIYNRDNKGNRIHVWLDYYSQYSIPINIDNCSLLAAYTTDNSIAQAPRIDLYQDTTAGGVLIAPLQQTISFAASILFDYLIGNYCTITLTGNATLAMSNVPDGGRGVITLIQDVTGSRLLTAVTHSGLTVKFKNNDNTLTTTANKADLLRYERVGNVLFVTLDKNY